MFITINPSLMQGMEDDPPVNSTPKAVHTATPVAQKNTPLQVNFLIFLRCKFDFLLIINLFAGCQSWRCECANPEDDSVREV